MKPETMHRLLNYLTISCREVTRLGSESRERRLTWRERLALRMHFRICRICSYWEPQVRCIEEALRHYDEAIERDAAPTAHLSEARKDAIREQLARSGGDPPA